MIEIRSIRQEDLPLVAEMEKALFADAWTEKSLAEELCCPFAKSYVLTEEGIPQAYGLFRLMAGEGEVLRIGTRSEKRRRGFARALLTHFLNEVKAESADKTFLEVRAGNIPARKLYEAMGFREISVRRGYYSDPTEDAIIYEKDEKETSNDL